MSDTALNAASNEANEQTTQEQPWTKAGKRRHSRKWQPTEYIDAMLGKIYRERATRTDGTIPQLQEFAEQIKWPIKVLHRRAAELGLATVREQPWTEAELKILARNAQFTPMRIQKILKDNGYQRTETAIYLKLRRERLTGSTPYYSACALARLFGVDSRLVTRWIGLTYLKAIRRGTRRKADDYLIHHKDVQEFVTKHPNAFDLRKVDQVWFMDVVLNKKST